MKNLLVICALALVLQVLSGCATPTKMAFLNDSDRLTEKSKPIFLMTVTFKNVYKTSFQPRLLVLHVEKPDAKQASDRINFTMDDKAKNETNTVDAGNNYLLRMELDQGDYVLRGMTGLASVFLINGFYFAPLHCDLKSKDPGVFYLGHVNATVCERKGEEFKAGPSIPLLDQAIAGASGGTFDIEIVDDFKKDEAVFRSKFPALASIEIKKTILPPFDRVRAQKWWEAH